MQPDPDEEWARWIAWLGEGPASSIWEDVVAMMAARQIWEGFRILYSAAPDEARRNGTFNSWLAQNYLHRQALAIRRQIDTDHDVVSLGHLIQQVSRYPHILSRDRYIERTAGWANATEAGEIFDEMVGVGRDHIDRDRAKADLAKLKTGTARIVHYVHNELARYNRAKGQFSEGLTFADITRGIDLIVDLSVKYRRLIMGSSMVKTVSIAPWIGMFDTAWIPTKEQLYEISGRLDEIDSRRIGGESVDDVLSGPSDERLSPAEQLAGPVPCARRRPLAGLEPLSAAHSGIGALTWKLRTPKVHHGRSVARGCWLHRSLRLRRGRRCGTSLLEDSGLGT